MKDSLSKWMLTAGGTLAAILLGIHFVTQEKYAVRPLEELSVRFSSNVSIPDPAQINNTGEWYYLDHVSSGLSHYDSEKKKFSPLIAESWSSDGDGSHHFRLRPDARFHDGSAITAKDVLWTLKRQLILRKSTHFPLWDYVLGCEKIRTLDEECSGLRALSDHEIEIRLKAETESFFLQLASPETGIWSASDMDPKTLSLKPTKFSGPYFVSSIDDKSALFKRNAYSRISEQFPDSPRSIRVKRIPLVKENEAILNHDVDLVVRLHSGSEDQNWATRGIETRSTTTSGIVHFVGLGKTERPPLGKDFLEALWKFNQDPVLTEAKSFLPFESNYGLRGSELLEELPNKTAKRLRILGIEGFFTKPLLDQIKRAAASVGCTIEYSFAPFSEWVAQIENPDANKKYDYLLAIYAASERYPAVQLRYLTGPFEAPPIDLKKAESPDLSPEQVEVLRDYQKWLLRSRQAIPFYFTVTEFVHQKGIDLGEQPMSDAEVELWRVKGR